jgi:hypothetical protein
MSAVKWVEFVTDRISYIILSDCWRDIDVLNVHAHIEDKIDDMKGTFYEEIEHVFNKFTKHNIKIW